jgi:broad specificity phosphatase PhoE
MPSRRAFLASAAAFGFTSLAFADDKATWDRLRAGGLVLLMRHASTTEGLGDPKDFKLGECSTQRNLSERGRDEARQVGERFRQERVAVAKVFTSPWCRCRDTATLAFGRAEDWTPLSSAFDFPHQEPEFTERVKKRIGSYAAKRPAGVVVMVTHNVNIAALSRYSVAPAELVLMSPSGCCDAKPLERLKVV